MEAIAGEKIFIYDPTEAMLEWCRIALVIDNPEYIKKKNMGLWVGNIPRQFQLYEKTDKYIAIPFGCLHKVHEAFPSMRMCSSIFPSGRAEYASHINLYSYQENAVQAILRAKNGILVMPCGAGKTQTALEVISKIGMKALWLTHTQDLLNQSYSRAKSVLGIDHSSYGMITAGKINIGRGITFATVQTASKIDLTQYRNEFGVIIVDECLPGNTKIMTDRGEKELMFLSNGDKIASYNRNTDSVEYKPVTNTFKLKAHDIVKISLENGEVIYSTGNHPFFTKDGWADAKDLVGGHDYVMQLLWSGNRREQIIENESIQKQKKRMGILFKRLLNKRRTQKRYMDGGSKTKSIGKYANDKCKISRTNYRQDEKSESDEKCRDERKSLKAIKRNRTSSKNTMWKWAGSNCSAANVGDRISGFHGCLHRVSNSNKDEKGFWLSDLLQGRHINSKRNDRDRDRWKFALCDRKAKTGREKGCVFKWIRVESVEVQKQTSDGTFGGLCPDGYVYNIEVADNNNYFANGILVHNCHRAVGTPTKAMQFYKVLNSLSCRYKIGVTATPKRSDGMSATMFSLIGDIVYEVTREEVAETTCPVEVIQRKTNYSPDIDVVLCGDGTVNYSGLVNDLTSNRDRFIFVAENIEKYAREGSLLVLGSRVDYLSRLNEAYSGDSLCLSSLGNSKKAKEERKRALKSLNDGEINVLFATYQLAKEGIDVPNLRYVLFATPEKDEATVIQAAGRVARRYDGKKKGTVIDFVDNFGMFIGWAKKRENIYRKKLGFEIK